ncbi:hypothetical protein DFH07DRAFT_767560 [Mycena maculata]|uniref:Uncharacterized protein n=1 Tax=Mycena maculata TaxID=230809 RepID=A0AAD7NSY1_9AGAR|nr:hypothetical protein DFH07DRAFT_767560 [Mycena maculata]
MAPPPAPSPSAAAAEARIDSTPLAAPCALDAAPLTVLPAPLSYAAAAGARAVLPVPSLSTAAAEARADSIALVALRALDDAHLAGLRTLAPVDFLHALGIPNFHAAAHSSPCQVALVGHTQGEDPDIYWPPRHDDDATLPPLIGALPNGHPPPPRAFPDGELVQREWASIDPNALPYLHPMGPGPLRSKQELREGMETAFLHPAPVRRKVCLFYTPLHPVIDHLPLVSMFLPYSPRHE